MGGNILVLGLGELGTAVVEALSHKRPANTDITVLLRPSSIHSSDATKQAQISKLKSRNIKTLSGDISDNSVAQLSELFRPYDLIISCLGFASGRGSQLKIVEAVLSAGIKRYVPWQFGVDYDIIGRGSAQDLFDEQLDVRDRLRSQSSTEWLIISTGMFTSFLFEPWFGVVDLKQGTVRALGNWENQVTVTTPEDIGKLTAEIVFESPRLASQVIFTAGETITYGKLAEVVEEAKGKKMQREEWSVEVLKLDLEQDPENAIKKYRVVFADGKGVSWEKGYTFNAQRSIEVEDVRSWALKNL